MTDMTCLACNEINEMEKRVEEVLFLECLILDSLIIFVSMIPLEIPRDTPPIVLYIYS